ncbi:uncharacterized protein VP01_1614g1 [Puccinia sorghi]|uniref:Uncharacterized protein n=1 Tax=Puccinia sorghi TaxID=27349 RepID=A0A0L6VHN3_9BASI|nr:uncharacterized protein VP01_1614g1 [Puccinia sorghi]
MPSTKKAKYINISEMKQQPPPPMQKSKVWTYFKAMEKQRQYKVYEQTPQVHSWDHLSSSCQVQSALTFRSLEMPMLICHMLYLNKDPSNIYWIFSTWPLPRCNLCQEDNHQQILLTGMKYLSYTVDTWNSPNAKASMAITVHGITPPWRMLDCLVDASN